MASKLLQEILDDIKSAMKAHETETLSTLRTLHSDIKNEVLKAGAKPAEIQESITDETVLDVLVRSVKQKVEAIEMLERGNRTDKAEEEKKAIELYKKYLPQELSEEEVKTLIQEIKEKTGAASPKDMGLIMKELAPKTKGRFDSKKLSGLVQAALR